jgi:predicted ArsR family transcriptional regulator
MSASGFDEVVELASRLSPREQLKLVAQIGEKLSATLGPSAVEQPARGSAAAVLQAMHAPPHLDSADVDELDRAIQTGRMPPRYHGVFEQGSDA